ncbi:hypothetical protein ACM01_01430 [Streptomyces viridochromogenes]|uniref:Acyl-CoA dehydrogenase C-terminal domain-containing protein n=1 Tax=Streptomyces viridochromogenes TaxID=1938 RepID=A0A0J7ZQ83_STRVR|nr:acyl-CoA dehydrogenase family protein [Streptomyces viridochromogenes]KMS77318.1 hypothetical protein ACM01_01430 [Streptomyces viridochromogenes]KOG19041.1 hypothetical protein ADK36_20560 [Streptomyces viridochromogenes]KOG19280.1 hypothetical protein ADK35_20420 [Streptomyces viridochromogenes]
MSAATACAPPVSEARRIAEAGAHRADLDRCLAAPTVRALTEAGFPRHFVPRAFGGAAGGFTDCLERVAELSEGCAAAGWCASLFAAHARMAGFLPAEGQARVWRDGPDARIAAVVVPSGEAARTGDGWSLSGTWQFVSGVDFADWALLACREPETGAIRFFAVPRDAWAVEDTWYTVGLRGTGSRTVHVDAVFVPGHLTFAQADLLAGRADPALSEPCHAVPFRLVNGLTMVAPALGAARGALAAWTRWIARKTEVSMGSVVRAAERPTVQSALARASAAIDSAGLLLERVARAADSEGAGAQDLVPRSHRDHAIAADLLATAVESLMRACGARGQAEGSPVERAWRDVHAAASHAALQFDSNAALYARHVLGERQS